MSVIKFLVKVNTENVSQDTGEYTWRYQIDISCYMWSDTFVFWPYVSGWCDEDTCHLQLNKNTGCFIISDPTFSVYKMVIFWAFWSEILDLEISLIYILITTSGFSNISIKNSFLDTCFQIGIWLYLGYLRPTLSTWLNQNAYHGHIW